MSRSECRWQVVVPHTWDEKVLRLVGAQLGALASQDLKTRCRDGLEHSADTWAARKRELTPPSSSRWAGSITKASHDQWAPARRGQLTLYLLDEPTTGPHPADVEVLMRQLHGLVDAGHTDVVVEHDMAVVAGADWVIDLGPGGGDAGGRIVAAAPPAEVARATESTTAPCLARALAPCLSPPQGQ